MVTRVLLVLLCLGVTAPAQTKSTAKKATPKAATAPVASAPASASAVIHTTAGDMKCELFPDKAPKAVANFMGLARGTKVWTDPSTNKPVHGKPLYDGVIFHRVIPGFVIQGGDPSGTGMGDVGINFDDELHPDLLYDQPGRLGMANHGPNTNGSQFFITEKPLPQLNPYAMKPDSGYTIFGQCDAEAVELVKKITQMPCTAGPCNSVNFKLQNPVKIQHIDIQGTEPKTTSKPAGKKSAAPKKAAPKSSIPN